MTSMNQAHLTFLASPEWADTLRTRLLPWLRETVVLGDDVLEVGPGPGLTTDLLLQLTERITAVEIDADLARQLAERLHGTRAEVVHGDATTVDLEPDRFSAATCFTMLHHVESPEAQDRLFVRVCQLLCPGGVFVGADSVASDELRDFHVGDTYVPVDPDTLELRLTTAGFTDITVIRPPGEGHFRFTARKPRA
ncbi:class I SAM-dependent methyltransferase [Streptomyces sp. NPDC047043]|uniref:class I SAM-dependent methyltransferase n=1 Tax=Streptomyces sp. NPDC047043 TaxID=3154497 RepID=UPI0033D62D9B